MTKKKYSIALFCFLLFSLETFATVPIKYKIEEKNLEKRKQEITKFRQQFMSLKNICLNKYDKKNIEKTLKEYKKRKTIFVENSLYKQVKIQKINFSSFETIEIFIGRCDDLFNVN